MTNTALPAFRWLPSMVILVPPDRGPVEGCTRPKYGDWKDRLAQWWQLDEANEWKQEGNKSR